MAKKKRKNNPGAGRPVVPENKRLRMRWYRMNDDDYAEVEQAGGEKLSEWTRKTLLKEAKRLITAARRQRGREGR